MWQQRRALQGQKIQQTLKPRAESFGEALTQELEEIKMDSSYFFIHTAVDPFDPLTKMGKKK